MAKVISVSLQKGGTGKTTTAHTIANILGKKGNKVLLIDCDDQANSTAWTIGREAPMHTITEALSNLCDIQDTIIHSQYIDLIPADDYLANINRDSEPNLYLFRSVFEPLNDNYDYIILDTPPSLSNVLNNALVYSDYVLIPTEARPDSMIGIDRLVNTIKGIQASLNPSLKILGILLIKYHDRTVLNRQIKAMIEGYAMGIKAQLFDTQIREGISVPEARMMCKPLIDYAPPTNKNNKPTLDYMKLVDEILRKIGD